MGKRMKIHPPKAIVDDKDPFKEALFGRKEFGESLTGLIRNVSENLVIFVNAPWGEGKTTFAQMWRAYLQNQKLEVIYFDAYAADYFDDPFLSFSGEILNLVEKRLTKDEGLIAKKEFKQTAIEVGKKVAGLAAKLGLKAATLGVLAEVDFAVIKEIKTEVASGLSEIGADLVEKQIENYTKEKDALKAFKESLTKLASQVREEQGFPLTIIVDELDRCRPDFALGLLERIKHLFDVEGLTFVLLVNRDQIESYVRTVYGEQVDAHAYLMKFANLFVDLPNKKDLFNPYSQKGRPDYCDILFSHHGFDRQVKQPPYLRGSLRVLSGHFDLTLREIEKVFCVLALYYSSLPENQITEEFVIAMLSVLKIKYPPVFQKLGSNNISAAHFFKETGLDKIEVEDGLDLSTAWIKDTLNYYLMSEDEFKTATHNADGSPNPQARLSAFENRNRGHRMHRLKLIPYLCRRLDRYSLNPQ
jgi:hypothetical protein